VDPEAVKDLLLMLRRNLRKLEPVFVSSGAQADASLVSAGCKSKVNYGELRV